jgi:hydroxylysine kinase
VTFLALPFEQLSLEAASALLAETWGIDHAQLERLDTERDDSFHVQSAAGEYVLKVAHPEDDPLAVNLQTAALSFASELEPRLPLQRLLLSREGDIEPVVDGRVARLLTWLPGSPVFSLVPDAQQLVQLGETLGLLSQALSTFDHPAAHREFEWDSTRLDLIASLRSEYPCAEIDAAFAVFEARVAPVVGHLPHQVIHNDFHPGNVLADASNPDFVTGVLDFGDTVYTARVADLAVALSYLQSPLGIADTKPFIDGFERVVRLTDAELSVLPALVAARFAQRILINVSLARGNPGARENAIGGAEQNRAALGALLEGIS